MTRDAVIAAIREIAPRLRAEFGVVFIGIFGSLARGDARPDSDVDVAVRFERMDAYSLDTMAAVVQVLESRLGCPIDLLVAHDDLRPSLQLALDRDLIRVA